MNQRGTPQPRPLVHAVHIPRNPWPCTIRVTAGTSMTEARPSSNARTRDHFGIETGNNPALTGRIPRADDRGVLKHVFNWVSQALAYDVGTYSRPKPANMHKALAYDVGTYSRPKLANMHSTSSINTRSGLAAPSRGCKAICKEICRSFIIFSRT